MEIDKEIDNLLSIPEYFTGKIIFITGGTGFIGKVLIEKLLYSCPELDIIYLLMREKKDVKPADRVSELYNFQCFDRLRKEEPGLFERKVKVVAGDIAKISLGLSDEDKALLVQNTNIVFHSAASIRFNDHLAEAVKLNLRGTKEMIELAKDMPNLESFVHVSTAFSNSHKDVIDEVMYPPLGDWRATLEICESLGNSQTLQALTSKFIEAVPNTYIFTKHLAEQMIYEEAGTLPIVIYRPSIVTASADEPVPGWIDNYTGLSGIMVVIACGLVRTLNYNGSGVIDIIPVDVVAKGAIVAAWDRGIKKSEVKNDIPIYNACSSDAINITLQKMLDFCKIILNIYPMRYMLWTPGLWFTSNANVYYLLVLIFQLLPALLIDSLLKIFGKKPILWKLQSKIFVANIALHPFAACQWDFSNKNYLELCSKVQKKDCSSFYCDLNDVNLFNYFTNMSFGAYKFLFKEKEHGLPKLRRNYQRMLILDKITKYAFVGCLLWWFLNKSYAILQAYVA